MVPIVFWCGDYAQKNAMHVLARKHRFSFIFHAAQERKCNQCRLQYRLQVSLWVTEHKSVDGYSSR
jgi:hypothetical protein